MMLESGVSQLDERAREVLELCLASESPETRLKVYSIIKLSGLDPSDPLFLVLALTGQMRVLLEAAPAELGQLLDDWKQQNAESLLQIQAAIALVKETHLEQVEAMKQALSRISLQCVSDLKEVGMATSEAIAEANNETLNQARQAKAEAVELIESIKSLHASVAAERQTNQEMMTSLVEKFQQTTVELNRAHVQLKNSIWSAKKFQQQASWAQRASWFTPLLALLLMAGCGGSAGVWLTSRFYSSPTEVLGRQLTQWNQKQLVECMKQNNSQCTIRIVPPDSSR